MATTVAGFTTNPITESTWASMFAGSPMREWVAGFAVTPAGATRTVTVAPGAALLSGPFFEETLSTDLALSENVSGSDRTDLIVVRADWNADTIALAVVEGSGATAPTPTRDDGNVWEVPLAAVALPSGAGTVTAGMIADRRSSSAPVFIVGDLDDLSAAPPVSWGALLVEHGTGRTATSNGAAYVVRSGRMVGEVVQYAGASAPDGWLLCDGSTVSRSTHAALFGVIGTAYGAGDGSTTFQLPDFRDRVPMGGGTRGATGGKDSHSVSLGVANLPAHAHSINHGHGNTVSGGAHDHSLRYAASPGVQMAGLPSGDGPDGRTNRQAMDPDGAHSHAIPTYSGNSGDAGSGTAFVVPTVPSHQRVNFIIYSGV